MNKETVLKDLATRLKIVQCMIASVNKIELNTVYKYTHSCYDRNISSERVFDTYGYFECYNRESARFIVIASDSPKYSDTRGRGCRGNIDALNYVFLSGTTWKGQALTDVTVASLATKLTIVSEKDLLLLVGMKYKSPELEKILRGRKKLKYA
jgi:hypothetical protein